MPPLRLVLRAPSRADEVEMRAAHAELAPDGFDFLSHPELPFVEQLAVLEAEARGRDLPRGRVRATYLLAEVDGAVVGRVSIRHELNEALFQLGGHVGYAVRPAYRCRGYATEMLRLSVQRLRDIGVERALVTCDDDNVASAKVIERCGGVLEDVREVAPGVSPKRRYWIQT